MLSESNAAWGPERLTYKHGNYAIGWLLAKRIREAQNKPRMVTVEKIEEVLSQPLDALRQQLWSVTEPLMIYKGPLALFRNQTDVLPLLARVCVENYGMGDDPVVEIKKQQQNSPPLYPNEVLFEYLISKAPQIGGLS
jgi:hypothetical protein